MGVAGRVPGTARAGNGALGGRIRALRKKRKVRNEARGKRSTRETVPGIAWKEVSIPSHSDEPISGRFS